MPDDISGGPRAWVPEQQQLWSRLLQEELDRRFAVIDRDVNRRLAAAKTIRRYLADEMNRRFEDVRREIDLRFDSTIHMRIALQEEMDRRFTDLAGQLDRRFLDSERAVQAALAAAKEAVLKAETASERRFEAVNEFRAQLSDQAGTFMGRNEYLSAHQSLADKVDAAIGVLTERIGTLERRLDTTAGHDAGTREFSAQARELENLAANLKSAGGVSPARLNLVAAFSGLAVLISAIVLIVGLATGHLLHDRRPSWRSASTTWPPP